MGRPSALGMLMGGDDDVLTQTAKSWIEETFLVSHDMMQPSFSGNKYTKKGWLVEDDAIEDYVALTGNQAIKNEKFFKNDYIQGTPDVLLADGKTVVDIKAPWSHTQFNKYASYSGSYPCPSASYFWQLQGYMWLTDTMQAELAYVLKPTPQELLEKAKGDEFIDYDAIIPLKKRIKIFGFPRSNSHIARIENKVIIAREFLEKEIIPLYF